MSFRWGGIVMGWQLSSLSETLAGSVHTVVVQLFAEKKARHAFRVSHESESWMQQACFDPRLKAPRVYLAS
jgi:hypothetical protein